MAGAAARARSIRWSSSMPAREDSRRGHRPQQSGLSGAGGADRGPPRHLGLWIEQTEGREILDEGLYRSRARGCEDILIAVTDGLKGMPEALAAVYPADDAANVHRASAFATVWNSRAGAIGSRWPRRCERSTPRRPRTPRRGARRPSGQARRGSASHGRRAPGGARGPT